MASSAGDRFADLATLNAELVRCQRCPRLVEWRQSVGARKRAAFAAQRYWSRPVPGFGDSRPRLLIVGLAPAAHGANRTGRMFTGDRSGDWLTAALFRAGIANQPTSTGRGDGLRLRGCYLAAPVHCAPPDNKPLPAERDACRDWFAGELALAWPTVRAALVLGGYGWSALWPALRLAGVAVPRPLPRFGHGARVEVAGRVIFGCYHVSQQNTFTGRLTEPMLDTVLGAAMAAAGLAG